MLIFLSFAALLLLLAIDKLFKNNPNPPDDSL